MYIKKIQNRIFKLQDKKYQEFNAKLIPNIDSKKVIGVRTPALKNLAKEILDEAYGKKNTSEKDNLNDLSLEDISKLKNLSSEGSDESNEDGNGEALTATDVEAFLHNLPHEYFEENQLHAFILNREKKFGRAIKDTEEFLPYVDNWATCDQLSPMAFKKEKEELLHFIEIWLESDHIYTQRFGIGCLMRYFLDEDFDPKYLRLVAKIRSKEYYLNMMKAWYFATALAKQYDATIPFIENRVLDQWTHNKAIQKSIESFRVEDKHKEYLRTLRWKDNKGGIGKEKEKEEKVLKKKEPFRVL